MLEAAVETTSVENQIHHRFVIKVPALGNYRYVLFKVHHPVELYPIVENRLPDEGALRRWLRGVFASDVTKRIVANLYAQASG
jgi:hypothetical protein